MKTVIFSAELAGGTVEYTKIPAGWKSKEKVEIGTVRLIDRKLYYAGASYSDSWPKIYHVNWYPITEKMYEHTNI